MHTAFASAGAAPSEPNPLPAARPATIVEWLLRRDEAIRSRARLHAMSDHMLRDIGLTRGLIDEALRTNIGRT
jgi:uncharacterized protein YjiS (DUF1127 family)